jgi:hypothetical protein
MRVIGYRADIREGAGTWATDVGPVKDGKNGYGDLRIRPRPNV